MARFNFTLQTVLDQREHEEQMCQLELAQAQQALTALNEQLATMDREINAVNADMRENQLNGRVDINGIGSHRRYLAAMKVQVIQLAQKMTGARLAVEARQRKLAAAATQRKSIEMLRDKQKSRWQEDQDKRERDLLDEASMQIAFDNLRISDAGAHSASGATSGSAA